MKAGKTAADYRVSEPKQPIGSPHYPRFVTATDADGNEQKHLIHTEDNHKERFPEDHAALLAEHGSLHWEPPKEAAKATAPEPKEPEPVSEFYPRWHEHIHEDGSKEKRLFKTEEEFKAAEPEAHAALHS